MVQAKLTVGAPDDPYEREGDATADRVMRMPQTDKRATPGTDKGATPAVTNFVQRKCQHCEEEESHLHKIQDPFVQRSLEVSNDKPPRIPAGDAALTMPFSAKVAHFTSVIQGLCPSFTVNPSDGLVISTANPAPTSAALSTGPHPVGCCGLNILTDPLASSWKILTSQLLGPHTEPGPHNFVLPPGGSDIGFGNFTGSNTRTILNDVAVAGHEIIGHGVETELGIHNQGREDREAFKHHDPTVRIQNIIQHEQGLPAARDRGLAASGSHRGESFAAVEIDHFPFNVSDVAALPAAEQNKIQLIADFITTNNSWVDVIGHSDPVGSPTAKQQVSDDRANAVKQRLVSLGVTPIFTKDDLATYKYIDRPRFTRVAGVSDSQPPTTGAADNENWRRVEIFVPNHPAGTEIPPTDIPRPRDATPGADLATEQASPDPCHRLLTNSAFPAPAAVPAAASAPAPAPAVAPAPAPAPLMPFLQRKCAECEQEEKLQRTSTGNSTSSVSDSAGRSIASSRGNGAAMDRQTQSSMSSRFGVDLSGVNIHTDEESAGLNRELGAKAFTTGRDIYFNAGQYRPGTDDGMHLLAHELTHVIQQQAAGPVIQRQGEGDGGKSNIKSLVLEELIDEKGSKRLLFYIQFENQTQAAYPIELDFDGLPDPDKTYRIKLGNFSEYIIERKEDNARFSLVLIVRDTDGHVYKSIDPRGPIDKATAEAQVSINAMRQLSDALAQKPFPIYLNVVGPDDTTDKKDNKDAKDKTAPVHAAVKPVLNYNLPGWFAKLKELVLARIDADRKVNKDNPYLPDKIFFYGSDLVQKQPGRDKDWTIQVNKGDGAAYYSIAESKWPTAGDKEQGDFADGVVKVLYDKVQLILTKPAKDDKPIYTIDGTGGAGNKFQQGGDKPVSNPFKGLKKEDQDKLRDLLKQLTGNPKQDEKTAPPELRLSSDDVKALLSLADDPNKDQIIETLKEKTGGGVTTNQSVEAMIAIAKLKGAEKQFDIEPDKDAERVPPVVNRPVHGNIVQHDALIVAKKPVTFTFEVRDDVDALRVPWITIRWYANSDPKSAAPANWKDDKPIRYAPLDSDGVLNRKHWEVAFPAEGVYDIVAIVDHNFFLPNVFRTSVRVQDEEKVLQAREAAAYKGFLDPGTTSDIDFDLLEYSKGTVTRGKLSSSFKGATADEQIAGIDTEITRIKTIIDNYKKSETPEGIAMVEWGEKYLEQLEAGKKKLTDTRDEKDASGNSAQHVLACKGTYVSRTKGVRTDDLKLTCYIKKDSEMTEAAEESPSEEVFGYTITLYDYTQLFENEIYTFHQFAETSEGAMQALFTKFSKDYPDGKISLAFQKWDDKTDTVTNEYVKYDRVTDSLGKDIKSVAFSTPVSIAVNIVSAVLTVFPLTTAAGLALGILYNGAQTISELQDEAEKGTLTGKKAATSIGSMVLDVLPVLGVAGKGARLVQLGSKAYYVFEGAQLAGQAFLMYENGIDEIEKLRTDYFLKVAGLDDRIAELQRTNPSDPEIDKLTTERQELIDHGRDAGREVFEKMVLQQAAFFVGSKILHGVHEHYSALSKLEARGKIVNDLTGSIEKLTPEDRVIIADRAFEADIEVKPGKETKWIEEDGSKKLQVADDATRADIDALLDNPPADIADKLKPGAGKSTKTDEEAGKGKADEKQNAPQDEHAKKPAKEEGKPTEEATTSPVENEDATPTTATDEVHEYRIHEDGTITRCSNDCTLFAANAKGRAKDIQGVFGKEHANSKKANEISGKAAQLALEAKKASKIKDPAARKVEEQRLIGEATQLELDMAVLEKAMVTEVDQRVTKGLDDIKDFADKNPEHKGQFENRIKIREETTKEIRPKLTDPDPAIREEAWKALKREDDLTRKLLREMQKHVINLSKPDISKRFQYDEFATKEGNWAKEAKGELGVPGEVRKHRNETEQGKVSEGSGDDAGHLIANTFGAEGGERNLGKQNWIANEFGTWRQLEIMWAEKLHNGTRVFVEIHEVSHAKGERPFMRRAVWEEVDAAGKVTKHELVFGNFETAKSREATGAAPTQGVPDTGAAVFIWNAEREKRGLAPVYSDKDVAVPANDNE